MILRLADLKIRIDLDPSYADENWEPYMLPEDTAADLEVPLGETDFERERTFFPTLSERAIVLAAVQRNIYEALLEFDGFVIHGASIDVDGQAYLFSASHGTGKTTHMLLWKKLLGDRMQIVNGDRTIIRRIDDTWYCYGSPWCGKEGWNTDMRSPVHAVCKLERGEKNEIRRINSSEIVKFLLKNTLVTRTGEKVIRQMLLYKDMSKDVAFWNLHCNMDPEAAEVAYGAMKG